jgi:hypothetical protein
MFLVDACKAAYLPLHWLVHQLSCMFYYWTLLADRRINGYHN